MAYKTTFTRAQHAVQLFTAWAQCYSRYLCNRFSKTTTSRRFLCECLFCIDRRKVAPPKYTCRTQHYHPSLTPRHHSDPSSDVASINRDHRPPSRRRSGGRRNDARRSQLLVSGGSGHRATIRRYGFNGIHMHYFRGFAHGIWTEWI